MMMMMTSQARLLLLWLASATTGLLFSNPGVAGFALVPQQNMHQLSRAFIVRRVPLTPHDDDDAPVLSSPLPSLLPSTRRVGYWTVTTTRLAAAAAAAPGAAAESDAVTVDDINFESDEAKQDAVGNLIADDEWMGLSMELSEIVRTAVVEDIKKNARDFLGKDEYKLGDITKEIDTRVKEGVANLRGKEEYELGDFILAMDEMSKSFTEELTGKPYEAGDLSNELDKRVKNSVAAWAGKDQYEFGDLSREVARRVQARVEEFTGKDYEFGDISRAIEDRRRTWVKDFLGEEAAESYQFGDISKRFVKNWTGKEDYQFGDITKKLMGDLFGKRKKSSD